MVALKRRYVATAAAVLVAAGMTTAGDGASPGLWSGVSYLGPEELEAEIARRTGDMARASERIDELERQIEELRPEIAKLEADRKARALDARETIILHDRMARGGMLRLVLTAGSLTDAAVFSQMYSRVLEKKSKAFSELDAMEKELEAKNDKLVEDRQMLEKLKADLEEHRRGLEQRRQTLKAIH